ncbi:junE proto-oncogene, AP-1 transcription factor subunit [Genypterus blacodes]|uniref:junE proto-oncogene, AP-1 transcription factor subunit n=1 Tax=Genypterus blacodes TaxID=154954 RepID=UPI003F76393B
MNQQGGAGNQKNLDLSATGASMASTASPDLERLNIRSKQGLVTAGPVSHSALICPSQATNEQEGFADGFVKALADLHKQNQLVGGGATSSSSSSSSMLPVYTNLSNYNPPQMAYCGGETAPEKLRPPAYPAASPPSLCPTEPETQEHAKAENKKLRNRIAASKCRKRKLEQIWRLEERVKVLKGQNSHLASSATMLREQVALLRQKVSSHVTRGCQVSIGGAEERGRSH